ncbi:MAG: metal ABC transporter substrate-binding protein [Phycisphaeraceae bacterium]
MKRVLMGSQSGFAGLLLTSLFILAGCGNPDASGDDGRSTVVATTTMIEDLANVIGGEEVNVIGIMRTGEDPHVYEVKPKHATAIKEADLVLYNGLHLEATLDTIVKEQASGVVVALAEQDGIDPIIGKEGLEVAADPHCWMDISLYKLYATRARDALVEVAPEHADLFESRTASYLNELDELEAWVVEQFNTVPVQQRVIVTGHDAFAYFGNAYGIEVHGLIGISTEQEPKPQDIEALKQLIREKGIKAIFPESSLGGSLKALIEKVAKDTGASVGEELHSDSLGEPGTDAASYIGMIRHNTSTMVEALKGAGE